MFSVKGWSVDSKALKTQTQLVQQVSTNAVPDGESQKNKKRKRGKDKTPAVNDANVGELWEKTFEGKKDEKKKPKEAKRLKKGDEATGDEPRDDEATKDTPMDDKVTVDGEDKLKADDEQTKKPKNKNKKNKKQKEDASEEASKEIASTIPPPAEPVLPTASKLTPMQSAMRQKLISARFRHLNETLYTAPSTTSLALFAENPEMFDDYHSGFRQQVTTWPENPVDKFIAAIRERGKARVFNQARAFRDKKRNKESEAPSSVPPLPRTHGTCNIADLGCGDARLAQTFQSDPTALKSALKIMSFDLQSPLPIVTKADIANLPLKDGSVDVAIFCLALMGTNWIDFIEEAYRILHWKGELWVAEIKSRFGRVGGDKKGGQKVVEHSVGNKRKAAAKTKIAESEKKKRSAEEDEETLRTQVDEDVLKKSEETDVSGFVEVLKRRGFLLKDEKSLDLSNRMFVKMEFIKAAPALVGKNVREQSEERKGEDGTFKKKFKKFVEEDKKEVTVEDETKALKPCLYKIR